jgi:hypothetical protein
MEASCASRNREGKDILDFALSYNLLVASTFRKRQSHLVTFSSAKHSSQIVFVLTRRLDRRACLNCKVITRECVVVQHKLVLADFRFHDHVTWYKVAKITKTKWWKLKGETQQTLRERMITK